jgi:chromatin segregation and condensation protein Rec8/ScpA/Scc1 (kleisin family)
VRVFSELQKKFSRLVRAKQEPVVELDEFLTELVHGDPGRRDRALAFYQTLVLTSLDVTRVEQEAPFGDILIRKGDKFGISFSSSQMFSDTPTQ